MVWFVRSSDSYWVLKRNHQIAIAVRRMLKGMGKYGPLLKSREIITELSSGLFSQIQQDLLLDLQLDYFLRNHACQSRNFAKYGSLQMSPKMELCLLMNSIQQCIW